MVELLYRPNGNPAILAALVDKVNRLQSLFYKETGCLVVPMPHYEMGHGKPLGVEISETCGNLEKAVRAVIAEIGIPNKVTAEEERAYELVERVLQDSGHALTTPWPAFIRFLGSREKVVTAKIDVPSQTPAQQN